MGLFDKQRSISSRDVKSHIRKDRGRIPGSYRNFDSKEREKLAKDVFGSKYGSEISKSDYKKALRELDSKRSQAQNLTEKRKVEDKIKYLEDLGGLKR